MTSWMRHKKGCAQQHLSSWGHCMGLPAAFVLASAWTCHSPVLVGRRDLSHRDTCNPFAWLQGDACIQLSTKLVHSTWHLGLQCITCTILSVSLGTLLGCAGVRQLPLVQEKELVMVTVAEAGCLPALHGQMLTFIPCVGTRLAKTLPCGDVGRLWGAQGPVLSPQGPAPAAGQLGDSS